MNNQKSIGEKISTILFRFIRTFGIFLILATFWIFIPEIIFFIEFYNTLKMFSDSIGTTRYITKIHGQMKRLIHLNLGTKYDFPNSHIKVHNYIDKFLTTKPYGITYGKILLISMRTFGKVCDLISCFVSNQFASFQRLIAYCRFIIFSYKMLKLTS